MIQGFGSLPRLFFGGSGDFLGLIRGFSGDCLGLIRGFGDLGAFLEPLKVPERHKSGQARLRRIQARRLRDIERRFGEFFWFHGVVLGLFWDGFGNVFGVFLDCFGMVRRVRAQLGPFRWGLHKHVGDVYT